MDKEERNEHRPVPSHNLHRARGGTCHSCGTFSLSGGTCFTCAARAASRAHQAGTYLSYLSYARKSSRLEPTYQKPAVPDGFIPVIGYRAWMVSSKGFFGRKKILMALTHDFEWVVGVNKARCASLWRKPGAMSNPPTHQPGNPNCNCGFYGFKDFGEWELQQIAELPIKNEVIGRIKMFGIVNEHRFGYRSSHAVVDAIYDTGKVSRKVAKRYGVPCVPFP
jgi:hypothetical protein